MSVNPMTLFEAQLGSDETHQRMIAVKNLPLVAAAIGQESTMANLLPYLRANIEEQEDEVMLATTEGLKALVPTIIAGTDALPILDILEILLGVEETVVRTGALAAAQHVISHCPVALAARLVFLIKGLAAQEWFTGRVSACGVFAPVYTNASETEEGKDLIALFKTLAADETPMVRRSAAAFLGDAAKAVQKDKCVEDICPLFATLQTDEADSVRELAGAEAAAVATVVNDAGINHATVFPTFKNCAEDRSWRVRKVAARTFADVTAALALPKENQADLVACFAKLLRDPEAEVRGAAALNIDKMVALTSEQTFIESIAPTLDDLSKDATMDVRSKLAQALMNVASPENDCITDETTLSFIRPVISGMLSNEDESDEVKNYILTQLPRLGKLLKDMDEIVAIIKGLSKYEANWRTRECVARTLPAIAEAYGLEQFSQGSESYLSLWLGLLSDTAASVRMSCIAGTHKIFEVAVNDGSVDPSQWVTKHVLDAVRQQYESSTFYLTRITILGLYAELCPDATTPKDLVGVVAGFLITALSDPVSNVRACAARFLCKIVPNCEDSLISSVIQPKSKEVGDKIDLTKDDVMDCDHETRAFLKELNGLIGQ